ncbi:uncharacterized protein [Haliotis asinina]|uniref:uncharacterized protein isoform X2 n=1 Tax=Haliotis asinina TaxID=109174 RepID=UPI00353215ED
MGRHNKQAPRQDRGRGRGRGQDRGQGRGRGEAPGQRQGLGYDDLRPKIHMHDVGETGVGHELNTARRVEVVHKSTQDEIIIPNRSPTRVTGWTLSGHSLDAYAEEIGRNSRLDMDKGNDAEVKFLETTNRSGSQENDMMHSVSASRKRIHPANESRGQSLFRNSRSRSPDRTRIKKHKLNVDIEGDTKQGYHNQREPFRRNLSPAQIVTNMGKYIKENKNVYDRMQFGTQRNNCVATTSAEPVDSEERIKSSSTAEKENLASLILRTVCVDYPGKVDLANLRKTLHQKKIINFSNTQTLYDFLTHYDNVFEIEGDTDRDDTAIEDGEVEETVAEDKFLVTGHPNLLLCQQHSRKAGSCTQDCRSLHICKYFVLSKCTMQEQGKTCIFGHDMDTEHNKEVLRKSLLHTFKTEIEIEVLRSLRYRNSTTVPAICNYYNKLKGCNNAECGFMHTCVNFLHGSCSAPYRCNYSHDIVANQPLHCLRRYGIRPSNYYETEIVVKTLKSIATKQNHQVEHNRQVQCSTGTQGMFTDGYNKEIPKPNNRHEVASYSANTGCSTRGKIKVSEKLTTASNQTGQIQMEAKERQEEKEEEVSLRNSSTVWTWSWKSPEGTWSDVTDSQIFEDRYKEYMQARKRSFVINGKMCEVDFATKTGVIDGEDVLSFKRVRKPVRDWKCSTSDVTDGTHVINFAGSDEGANTDVATKRGVTDGEVAHDFKRVVKRECDTKCPSSGIMNGSHVTDVAASDADVATKTGMMEEEVALYIKKVVTSERDTKCFMSDITDDSHVTDVAASDADVGTKTGMIDGELALDFRRVVKPDPDTNCSPSDKTNDSHVTDVADSDADVGTKTDVIRGDVALDSKNVVKPECDTKDSPSDKTNDSHVTNVADEGLIDVEVVLDIKGVLKPAPNTKCSPSDKTDGSHVIDVAGSDADVTNTDVIDRDVALDIKVVMKPECGTKCSPSGIMDDSHVSDVAASDADVATKTGLMEEEVTLYIKKVVTSERDTKCFMSDITDDSHVTDVAAPDANVGTKTDVIDRDVALDIKGVVKPECDTNCSPSDKTNDSHVTDVADSDADVGTKTDVIRGDVALDSKNVVKPECDTKDSPSDKTNDSHVTNVADEGLIDVEVVLDIKGVLKPAPNTKCSPSDKTDGSHVIDVAGSDADVTNTDVIDRDVALDIKVVMKPECGTKCSPSGIMDDSHVSDVAASDADVATKTGLMEEEVTLYIKKVVTSERDTKCFMSDITDDSHVTDVAAPDANVGTKTDVIDRDVALDIKGVVKPECDTKCSPSDITDDSHVTDVAASDAAAAEVVNNGSLSQNCNHPSSETP